MKNILKLSFLTVGITLSSSLLAQEDIKKDAATTADKLETPKATTETKTDAKTDKQEPVKTAPGSGKSTAAKTTEKADTTKTEGGTRMAISEQGTPKKNKNKNKKSTPPPPAEPAKK